MPTQRKRATKKVTRAKKIPPLVSADVVLDDVAPNPATPGLWDAQNGNMLDTSYHNFLRALQTTTNAAVRHYGPHIFTTDASPKHLWERYRTSFPTKAERQHHNCTACRNFIQRFGGLALIEVDGRLRPLLWRRAVAEVYPKLSHAIDGLASQVEGATVTGIWVPGEGVAVDLASDSGFILGVPKTPPWRHMSISLPASDTFRIPKATQTADQFMAERKEDFKNVTAAVQEFRGATLELAHSWLSAPGTPFSDGADYVAPLAFLMEFQRLMAHRSVITMTGSTYYNQAWRLLAGVPAGFCHPKSGMLGMLLTWIQENTGDYGRRPPAIGEAVDHWNIARDPIRYMRPTAAPKAGTIVNAEKIVKELGLEKALERRIADYGDLPREAFLWAQPRDARRPDLNSLGVFGHLQRKELVKTALPPLRYTWAKFEREVLPGAARIVFVPSYHAQNYIFLTAPVHPDAAKLFKWDNELAWYVYNKGSTARQVGLEPGVGRDVTSVICRPDQFSGLNKVARDCAILMLHRARETRNPGLALFPQCLRSELHEVRSVLEAHSRGMKLKLLHSDWNQAIGMLVVDKQLRPPIDLRVTDSNGNQRNVIIDRWD